MARSMQDVTTIYRFKVTTTGVHNHDNYPNLKGKSFEDVELIGPYTKKMPFRGWVDANYDVKVECQQLVPYIESPEDGAKLMWHTIEVSYYEKEDEGV